MPVYLFTYHAYGSWWPDRPQGFVQQGKGIQPTNNPLAQAYRRAATHDAVLFTPDDQRALIEKLFHIAETDSLRIHAATADPTHLHTLVSWADDRSFTKVRGRIKNLLSLCLSRRAATTGRPWFVQGASRKRVEDEQHYWYRSTCTCPSIVAGSGMRVQVGVNPHLAMGARGAWD